ncbi:MAG: esterase [Rubrivivax sp.]|nr:esterase [Rubrivivax sp.]
MMSTATMRRGALLLAALLGLAACDGGDPVREFRPTRFIAFGDESTLIEGGALAGRKYTVNDVDDTGAVDCTRYPIWSQQLATNFGFVFAECNPNGLPVTAQMRAVRGARVQDLRDQLADYILNSAPNDLDLVTVMVGMNDVLELYAQYPARTEADITAELKVRGENLARAINEVVRYGPRVVALTVADIGLSPYALAEAVRTGDPGRPALLTRLVSAFNSGMRLEILNDGRKIGLVFAQEEVANMVSNPSGYGLTNVLQPACAGAAEPPDTSPLPLLDCTDAAGSLVEGASATTWLWADTLRLGPTGQARLGSIAITRARNNPF